MKELIKKILGGFISACVPVDDKLVIFESEGDLSDNSYALYDYMLENHFDKQYDFVWLVENTNCQEKPEHTKYVGKKGKINIIRKMYYLSKCKYYIYDHCNYFDGLRVPKKERQMIVDLWHGCGVKSGRLAKEESSADLLLTTGKVFNDALSRILGVKKEKICSIGYPRTDYFYKPLNAAQIACRDKFAKYNKVILWMPTFRRSYNKELDEAYFRSDTGMPILVNEEDLEQFDRFLNQKNVLCVLKVHHLQAKLPAFGSMFTNIHIVSDEAVKAEGLQLYQLVALTDCLITDYSSIATDYMLLDRPILYTLDDYEEYNKSRGFIFDNCMQYFPGEKAFNKQQFYKAINDLIDGKDAYAKERKRINDLFNDCQNGEHCKIILKKIGIEPTE